MFDGPGTGSATPAGRAIAIGAVRLSLAATCVVALVGRFLWGIQSATFDPANYFAYLTMQSNFAFVIVTAYAGVRGMLDRPVSAWLATTRAAVLGCTITAGIVFALLVQQASQFAVRIDVPWSDQLMHFVVPVLALGEWVLLSRERAQWRAIVFVVGYAVCWGGITMLRGSVVDWYPYFFLDPGQVDGPGEFILFAALSLALFSAVTAAMVLLSRLRRRERGWFARVR